MKKKAIELKAKRLCFWATKISAQMFGPIADIPIPFDLYCPSVQDKLANRQCSACSQYFSTVSALSYHQKAYKTLGKITTIDIAEQEEKREETEPNEDNIYLIKNINDWLHM